YSSVAVSLMHRVCSRSKRSAGSSSVRSISCLLSVHYVGSNGQYGKGMYSVSVSRMLSQFFAGSLRNLNGDLVYSVIVVSVFREFAFSAVVNDNTVFVSDRIYLGILDS